MNEAENKLTDASEVSELKAQCARLSRQITFLLAAMVVASVTFAGYVGLQVRRLGKDLDALRPQGRQVIEANAKETPRVQEFMARLADYGRTHPEFQQIVLKYGLTNNSGPVPLGSKK